MPVAQEWVGWVFVARPRSGVAREVILRVRVRDSTASRVEALARRRGTTVSGGLREAVAEWLTKYDRPDTGAH